MTNEELEASLQVALDRFVRVMRAKLMMNRHKSGWESMHPVAILARLCEEAEELLSSCTPAPRRDRKDASEEVATRLDTQRELMLIAIHHVHCAAATLVRLRGMPKENVTTARTAGEAADVANFCMFLSHQLSLPLPGEQR